MYGENPQNQYGGPPGSQEAREMTLRWRSEYGGFLGLRPADLVGLEGITERDMEIYTPPSAEDLEVMGIEAHFLGQYLPWDSHQNAQIAIDAGMEAKLPSEANWWPWENQDNLDTFWHDHGMYRKYGMGRLCAQISVDIRHGRVNRDDAIDIVRKRDGLIVENYMGLPVWLTADRIGMTQEQFMDTLDQFTNWGLFDHVDAGRPILKESACTPQTQNAE
jgi:hypothetical protein